MSIKSIKTGWTGISALAGNPVLGNFEAISSTTVGSGGISTVTFSSIPSTFQHLQVRVIARAASTDGGLLLKINSSTASVYDRHVLYGSGSGTAVAGGVINDNLGGVGDMPTSSNTASIYGVSIIDILDYQSTVKNKTVRSLSGYDASGSGYVQFRSFLFRPTTIAAITTLDVYFTTNNLAQYSHVALYGIR